MTRECPNCGAEWEREPGFFLGSIYFNYGLTALIIAIGYPVLLFSGAVEELRLLLAAFLFTLLFPVVFFRHSRSLWLGFDQFCDPRPDKEDQSRASNVQRR